MALSTLSLALAKLGHSPDTIWVEAFLAASSRPLRRQAALALSLRASAAEAAKKQWEMELQQKKKQAEESDSPSNATPSDGQTNFPLQSDPSSSGTRIRSRSRSDATAASLLAASESIARATATAGFGPLELSNMLWALRKLRPVQGGSGALLLDPWHSIADSVATAIMPIASAEQVSRILITAARRAHRGLSTPEVGGSGARMKELVDAAGLRLSVILQVRWAL